MLIKFFRLDRPTALFLLPVVTALLWPGTGPDRSIFQTSIQGLLPSLTVGMPFYAPVHWLLSFSPLVAFVTSLLLMVALAHRVGRTANDAQLFDRRNHMPTITLPILLALMPLGLLPDPAFVGIWAVLYALGRVWAAMGRMDPMGPLFDAGCLIGIAALFYLPYAFLIVVIWSTLAVNRPFRFRDYAWPAVGLSAVLFMAWGAFHFSDPEAWRPVASMRTAAPALPMVTGHWMYRLILLVVVVVLGSATVIFTSKAYAHSVMREKNIRASFLAFTFTMGLLALFAWWLDGHVPPVLIAVPTALLLSYPLLYGRRTTWAEAGIWSLLLLALWTRWVG